MIKPTPATDWRAARRREARQAILDAAWELVREEGLAGLSLRDLASRTGITTPTVYAYFDSKHAIYDAMFAMAAEQLAEQMAEPFVRDDPQLVLISGVRRFCAFCASDPARYQLLFQRTLPGFAPSPESFAPAQRALDEARKWLALNNITAAPQVDLWTALVTGLIDQQLSNDPGGDRWMRLVDESMAMFLTHCHSAAGVERRTPRARKGNGG